MDRKTERPAIIVGQMSDALPPITDGVVQVVMNYVDQINQKHGTAYAIGPEVPEDEQYSHVKTSNGGRHGHVHEDPHIIRCFSLPLPRARPYRFEVPQLDAPFRKRLQSIPFDVVHAHSPFMSGHLALDIARKRNIPLVTTFHSKYRDDFSRYISMESIIDVIIHNLVKFYQKADLVWVPNAASGLTLREYGYTGAYEVMPNGVDLSPPDSDEDDKLRKRALEISGVQDGKKMLLYVGQIAFKKNLQLILDALKRLSTKRTDFHVLLVGEGPDESKIRKTVWDYGLEEQVLFLGKITDREDIRALYKASYLFLFPSLYDTAGLVVAEAAACRLPSLVVQGAHAAQGIKDGENGFLADTSVENFAKRLDVLLNNRGARDTAGTGAYQTLYRSWESVVDEAYERYLDLTGK
ncbi:MAG: glycosyltransferase [Spirochaetota bacterium]